MCGIAGLWDHRHDWTEPDLRALVSRMTATLRHRGPDDSGTWIARDSGVALGHTRLSILDLSPAGHQPMASRCGRFQVVFNGEIYNFRALRAELEGLGHTFSGQSDTEVLLAAIVQWGVAAAVSRFVGMFAFACWDVRDQRLSLVRDRLGIKPLYYGWVNGVLLFASELKALRQYPGFDAAIDRDALALFLRHNYIPAPWSIYRGIRKLPPGTWLSISPDESHPDPVPYWNPADVMADAKAQPYYGSAEEAAADLDQLLRDAVRLRMIADVPLGAFLSGGIDSSLVVALMQAQSSRPVRTFTIGFEEPQCNEAHAAEAVARHLGTDHTVCYVSPQEARDVIPRLPEIYDEPFADSSQIPTFLVSQLARRHVTVSLSGDGGDELFGGYPRYFHIDRLWRALCRIPGPLRGLTGTALRVFSALSPAGLAEKFARWTDRLKIATAGEMYCRHNIHWEQSHRMVLGGRPVAAVATQPEQWPSGIPHIEQWMYADTVSYLPDDILVKVDRASMAVGLEARVPLLDHRVVEFAWRLPLDWKVRGQTGKWLLQKVLERYVPRRLFDRPKMGFGVPIDSWLRGPLRDWAETLLEERRLRDEGFLDPKPIRRKWGEHLSRRGNWHYHLWDVLMFQAWLDEVG
ncbi:MAG: asparagine synthase (glutamine-hydrolyzing) [Thermoguttaceae bacterium]